MTTLTNEVATRLTSSGADQVKAQLTSITEAADKLNTKTANISIDANTEDWEAKAAEVLAQAKDMGADKVRITITADDAQASEALDKIRAEADALGLKKVTVKVAVEESTNGQNGGFAEGAEQGVGQDSDTPWGLIGIGAAITGALPFAPALIGSGLTLGAGGAGLALAGTQANTASSAYAAQLAAAQKNNLTLQKDLAKGDKTSGLTEEALPTMTPQLQQQTAIMNNLKEALNNIKSSAVQAFTPMLAGLAEFAKQLSGPVGQLFNDAQPGMLQFFKALEPTIKQVIPQIDQLIIAFSPFMGEIGKGVGVVLEDIVKGLLAMRPAFKASAALFVDFAHTVGGVFEGISDVATAMAIAVKWVADRVDTNVKSMASGFETAFNDVHHFIDQGIQDVENWYEDVAHWIGQAVATINRIPSDIRGAISSLASELFSAGENAIDGLWRGIESAVGGLLSYVRSIASDISGAFKSVLGIFSPSRVFAEHGKNIVQGLAQGITGNAHLATNAVNGLASATLSGASVRLSGAGGASGATINFNGVVTDPDSTARKIQQMLLQLKRHNGNTALGLG